MSENLSIRRDNNNFSLVEIESLADSDSAVGWALNRNDDGEVISMNVSTGDEKGYFELVFTPSELYTVRTPSDDAITEIGKVAQALNAYVIDDHGDIWKPEEFKSTLAQGDGSGSSFFKTLIVIGLLLSLYWWLS